jgi:hypothetical protein
LKPHGERFQHERNPLQPDTREHAGGVVIRQAHVSLTYLDIRQLGQNIETSSTPRK